ncbi:MAG: PAS domain-containing sensor histidine kinase [Leifsonia xyli]|nr:MAG: PAS domain-containing sensor histidine kinase [Leifsonia xyli]
MKRRLTGAWTQLYALLDNPSPLVKQSPTAIAVLIAVVLSLSIPELPFQPALTAWSGVVIVAVATGFAAYLTRVGVQSGFVVALVPLADIVGVGLLRAGTGGAGSLFGAILLLPLVWAASKPGFRYVVAVGSLSVIVIALPNVTQPPRDQSEWLRVIIVPVVYLVTAAIINELSRTARIRTIEAERLATERAETLNENLKVVVQLQASQTKYLELLELFRSVWNASVAQAVIGTDRDGLIVAWNPGATSLLGPEDLDTEYTARIETFFSEETLAGLGAEALSAIPDDPLPHGLRSLFALADRGVPVVRDLEMLRDDGTRVPVHLTITDRSDGAGERVGYLLAATDETRAIEVARMKDEFVGMISHELRTPLSSILGYLDLLRDDPAHPLSEDQLQFLEVAERNARRLLRLVGDLLFTAQVESGQFPLDVQQIDLTPVVRAAIESATPVADNAGVTLISAVPDIEVRLRADPVRIGQAIDNLVSNAIKFTPRGGDVVVTLTADAGASTISVRDTGLGIPPDEVDRLFTRFFRASTATRNAVPGVGLGLNITKAIVTAHGGWMDVASEEGVGTEFRIVLPRG